ncbi:kinase binding protein CGI-121-domain-containing protein [Nemania sp. FL0916]|nr:kinase binding protein CGI-121-domain-containing protein [Nemania sp. FL0916]
MNPDIQHSSEPYSEQDSQSIEPETNLTPTAKRQKTDHHSQTCTTEASSPTHPSEMSTSPLLEKIQLEHIPETHSVHVAVFRDVKNAAFLHQQLLARNPEFEYAFIDASVITSRLQVLSAVFKAVTSQGAGAMKTPNMHSETVCSLSPTNNITEAYRRYGISPTTRDLVIVKILVTPPAPSSSAAPMSQTTMLPVLLTPQEVEKHLLAHVHGKPVPFTDQTLEELVDWARVRKYYKLNGMAWLDGIQDPAVKNRETNMLVMSGMALRGV